MELLKNFVNNVNESESDAVNLASDSLSQYKTNEIIRFGGIVFNQKKKVSKSINKFITSDPIDTTLVRDSDKPLFNQEYGIIQHNTPPEVLNSGMGSKLVLAYAQSTPENGLVICMVNISDGTPRFYSSNTTEDRYYQSGNFVLMVAPINDKIAQYLINSLK